ncbi:NACHT domain-containing protein [Exiguobacterium sp. BRG2]|uniref:NACHT domain-containing protein n=1 Tax=Exiguobacterium sp. BRG2 TaxID=2962584 RepID=UPI002881A566|nr:NACHT domain-containing protein [Exiguobacterium sp. BRG2]MDT0173089.1 NACHT domain-containing protein [Exiguobacterium sp. BRG2]
MDYNIAATLIQPVITSLLDTLLKPKIQEIQNNTNQKLNEVKILSAFFEYINRSHNTHKFMNTIVFRNDPIEIYDLYCPLTLMRDDEKYYIDSYPESMMDSYNKIVITDDAGMGKSTLLKWIFVNTIHSERYIPIFIELRKLSKDKNIIDEIEKELNGLESIISKDVIYEMLKKGDFVFLLDGYDEIPQQFTKEVTEEIQHFISRADKNKFILTSRPQSAIASFNNFHEFKIKSLENEEAFSLIRKYDKKNTFSETLISLIVEKEELINLHEFLSNPLMVSLLYKGYEHKQTIPYKKSIFYRQVYDALFEDHDLAKGGAYVHEKLCLLDSEKFHTVLRALGFITFRLGKIEYSKDEIIECLRKAQHATSIEFQASDLLNDLINSVPLFYKEGLYYRWKHKSLQEYFTAQFICADSKIKQDDIMLGMYNNLKFDTYLNILDLCYDMDEKTFKKTILLEFLKSAERYFDSNPTYTKGDVINNEQRGIFFWEKNYILFNKSFISEEVQKNFFPHFNAAIRSQISESKLFSEGYLESSMVMVHDTNFGLVNFKKIQYKLIELLFKKGLDIFIEVNDKKSFYETYQLTPSIIINEFFSNNEENEGCYLIDAEFLKLKNLDKDLVEAFFEHVKEQNTRPGDIGKYVICENKIKRLKKQIEDEIYLEKSVEDFFDI